MRPFIITCDGLIENESLNIFCLPLPSITKFISEIISCSIEKEHKIKIII